MAGRYVQPALRNNREADENKPPSPKNTASAPSDELVSAEENRNAIKEQRDERAWQSSLQYRWAVLKFARDEVAERECGPPAIKRLADESEASGPKKSVNEMMAEMRLGGKAKVAAQAVA
ncbi:hypothetical protein LTR85_000500 [Meristemomyces frigidus]|nr:hypothetical protein LTR85_000500 [Meristemomyces frigidus]